jgi:hypothetical protein
MVKNFNIYEKPVLLRQLHYIGIIRLKQLKKFEGLNVNHFDSFVKKIKDL